MLIYTRIYQYFNFNILVSNLMKNKSSTTTTTTTTNTNTNTNTKSYSSIQFNNYKTDVDEQLHYSIHLMS